jgi:hypothetical protein
MTDAPALKPPVGIIDSLTLASSTPAPSVLSPVFDVEFGAPLGRHSKAFIIAVNQSRLRRASNGEQLTLPWPAGVGNEAERGVAHLSTCCICRNRARRPGLPIDREHVGRLVRERQLFP